MFISYIAAAAFGDSLRHILKETMFAKLKKNPPLSNANCPQQN